jgi:hypothetical protein
LALALVAVLGHQVALEVEVVAAGLAHLLNGLALLFLYQILCG